MSHARGVDGLTIEELRSSRDRWWDAAFTRVLLDAMPAAAATVVEIGCGLARAAHELLPHRRDLRYLGIDVDHERLATVDRERIAAAFGDRINVVRAAGERLPLAAGSVDVMLTAMTLQHIPDVDALLREARRVLSPDGILVAAEPDHLGHRFYFDGPLEPITSALAALMADRRAAKLPADLAVGPRVPSLLRAAGFRDVSWRVHCLQEGGVRTAAAAATELLETADAFAAIAGAPCDDHVQACKVAVDRWFAQVGPETTGEYGWSVPVFVTRGRR